MARSDSAHLTALKNARDAIVDQLASGRATVRYRIGRKEHETTDPAQALAAIREEIRFYSRKTSQRLRLASIRRPRGT